MEGPLVTLGLPVYRGHETIAETLAALGSQTHRNIEVLISIDGPDDQTIAACEPFLSDPRFRMHVQPERLGWAGNLDWTLRHRGGEFFTFQQHDDSISPTYVADLLAAAARWPEAAVCFAQMEVSDSGAVTAMVRQEPLLGSSVERALTHMQRLDTSMFRGLIRGSALDATHGLLPSEFDSYAAFHRLTAELALRGEFRFVDGPTYYKRLHGENLHLKWYHWSEPQKRAAWASLATAMVEVIVPVPVAIAERWRVLHTVLDRFLIMRPGRFMFTVIDNDDLRSATLGEIAGRLRRDGRFDPACLETSWEELESRAARDLALR